MLLGTPLFAQQADSPLSKKITVSLSGGNILDALHKIEKAAGIEFAFNAKNIDSYKAAVITFTNKPLEQVLKELFQKTPLTFSNVNGYIIIQKKPDTPAPGKVSGVITDEGNGEPVPGVTIRIGNLGTTTAADGSFNISLPAGNYTATLSYIGYTTKKVSDIEVKDHETFTLNLALRRTKGQLATVEVTSSAKKDGVASLYIQQKNNAAISDGISQEQIRRTPDNNVAHVLKRISGLTVQDDKFVTVRGLSERYNNVMMNGTSSPARSPTAKTSPSM